MESRLPFSCFPYVPRQRCIGERAEAGGTRFSASISAAGRCLSLSFWTSMNYSTQDYCKSIPRKSYSPVPACLPACPTCEDTSRTATKRKRKRKQRKKIRQKEPSKSYASRLPRLQPKVKTDIGSSPRGESRKIHRLLLGTFAVTYQSILLTWLLGHHLLPMLKSAEWPGSGWSPMSLLAFLFADRVPCIVVVVVVVVAKPVSQPSSGGMDGWMYTYYLDSHVLDGCCAALSCVVLGWYLRESYLQD